MLNGTDVATMFLDRQLCIRKFTPRIAEIFRVIPQDVGRPLRTFAHDLLHPTLPTEIERVLHEGVTIEAQMWDRRQRCYFLRILPLSRPHARGQRQRRSGGGSAPRSRQGGPDEVLWRADGTSFPAEYWSHPVIRNDEVIGAVVTFLDITERRRAEAEVQQGVRRREQFLAMLSTSFATHSPPS